MKKIILLLVFCFCYTLIFGQSRVTITQGASISVGLGANINSGSRDGTMSSSGTFNLRSITFDPVSTAATAITQSSFAANWNASAGALGYRLDVSTSPVFASFVTGYQNLDVGLVTTFAVNSGIISGNTYYYRVRAYDVDGTTGYSNVITLTTAPDAPVASAASAVNESSFTANWSSVTGATKYFLDIATTSGFTAGTFVDGYNNLELGAVISRAVTGLSSNTTYYYRVRAANAFATSTSSGTITVLISPAPPTAAAATSLAQTSFDANWSASAGATKYFLDVSTVNTFASFVTGYQNLDVGNVTAYTVSSGLTAGSTYYFRVRAFSGGTSTNSNIITVLTVPPNPAASAATSITQTAFNANWGASTSAEKYFIDVATDAAFTSMVAGWTNVDAGNVVTFAVNTNLAAGTTYYYRVRSNSVSGTSGSSNTITIVTVPPNPVTIAATAIGTTTFDANWNASSQATKYFLDVSASNTFSPMVTGWNNVDVGNVTTFTVNTNLTAGTQYYYRVRANNANGTSGNSNNTNLTTIPPAPVQLAAGSVSTASFNANWNPASGASKYFLDVSTDNTFGAGNFVSGYENLDVGSVLTYTVNTNLTASTNYYYRIRAFNSGGTSASSGTASLLTAPVAPAATAATAVTSSSFSANWNAAAGADGYYIDVATDNSFAPGTFVGGFNGIDAGNVLTYSVNINLTPGTTYYYRIRSYNTGGTSINSNTITGGTAPAAPITAAPSSITSTGFNANWNTVSGATGYRLDVSTASDFSSFVPGYEDINVNNVLTYSISGLSENTTYYFRVRGYNGYGTGASSSNGSAVTSPAAPVSTAASSVSGTSFVSNWNASAGASGYYLDVSTVSNFSTFLTGYNNLDVGNTTSRAISVSSAGISYYYRVRAYNPGGTSPNSLTQTVTATPPAPAASAATAINATSFQANWSAATGAAGYRIDVSTASDFSGLLAGYNDLNVNNVTNYSVTGLTAGNTYYYRVRAYNGTGSGANSNIITVVTTPPAPVEQAATSVSNNSFAANWNSASGASGYKLDVSTVSNFASFVPGYNNLDVGNVITYTVSGLSAGTSYYYRVRAFNGAGESGYSGSANPSTSGLPPRVPASSPATNIAAASFSANWVASSGATKYYLDVSAVSNFATFITGWENVDVGNVITYSVNSNISAGGTYYYRVRAFNADGTSGNSTRVTVLTVPSAPAEQAASNIANSSFDANWNASAGASGYRLDVSTASDFSSFVTGYNNLDVSNVITYKITGLIGGTPYYYRIRAYNTGGTSASSGTINPTTAADPAGTLNASAATAISQSGFTANWSAFGGATGYKLEVATDPAFGAGALVAGYNPFDAGNVTSSAVAGLSSGTVYYYRVTAYDGTPADIGVSGIINVITIPGDPVSGAPSSIGETSFTANWTGSTGATGYYLDVATDNLFTSFVTGYNNRYVNNVTAYSVTGLTAGTRYYYQIRAKNGSGTSGNSASGSAYTIPKEPSTLAASGILSAEFSANWNSSDGAAGYYIDVATDAGFTSPVAGWTNVDVGNVTSKSINTGLNSGTVYYYRVRASNTGGTSGNSSFISLATAPAAPAANNPTAVSQTGFTANWSTSTGATKYFLDVATTNTFDGGTYVPGLQNLDVSNVVSYSVSGLSKGTNYYYKVRAYNSNGTSDDSNVKTALTIPENPAAEAPSDVQTASFKAKWTKYTGTSKIYLDVATDNTFLSILADWSNKDVGNVSEYIVNTGLSANTTYYYRVRAENASGTSGNSGIGTVTTSPNAPVATAATTLEETTIKANWNTSAGADGYLLDVSTQSDFSSFVAGYQQLNVSNVTAYTVTGLTGGTTYYYRVRSYTGGKSSSESNQITALTKPAAGSSAAPTGVTASGFNANWNTTSSAAGYNLQVSTNSGFTSFIAGYGPKDVGNVTSESVGGLSANTVYYYRVSPYNASGSGSYSATRSIITAPAAPVAQNASGITNVGLTANWNSAAGATGYYLDVATDNTFLSMVAGYNGKDVGNVTSAAVASLNGSLTYYYRVRAYNAGGSSVNSNLITSVTAPDPSPAPVATAASVLAQTSFTANWNSAATATGYRMDISTDNLFATFIPGYEDLDLGNILTKSITGLNTGTTYYYRIRSYNGTGTSSNSNSITAVTIPAAPVSTAAASVAATSFNANWNASAGATKYYLDIATDNIFTSFAPGFNNLDVGNVTTYAAAGLSAGTTYYYRIRAFNGSGTSESSGSITVLTIPPAPVSSAASAVTETGFTANWNAATGASKYLLDVSTVNTFASFVTGYNGKDVGNVTTYALSGLTANTTYYYRVRSFNASGTSGNSGTIAIIGLPTSGAATAKSESGFTANWTAVAGATKYYLDVSTAIDFSSFIGGYNNRDVGDVATYAVSGLSANTTYYYRLRANNADGTSGNSGSITVLTAPPVVVAATATSITPTYFTANWGASAGAAGYYLDVATDNAFTDFLTGFENKDVGNVTTYLISGIERGTSYYYRLRSYNASAASSSSNIIAILASPLASPATDIMQTSLTANWGAVSGAIKYYFDLSTDPAFGIGTFVAGYQNRDVGNVSSVNIPGLIKNTDYYYRVRAYDGSTTSDNSNFIAVRTLPDAPTALAATTVTQSEFNANWIIPGGSAPGYRLDVASDIAFTNILAAFNNLATGNVLTYQVTGLTPGGTYYFRVRAQNSWGASDNSNIITVVLKPANPVATDATDISISSITAHWNAAAGAAGYYIDVATDNAFTSMVVSNSNLGNVLSYTLNGLSSNTPYYYRVRAFNATGTGGNSNTILATTLAEQPVLAGIESSPINYNVKESDPALTDSTTVQCPSSTPIVTAVIQITSGFVRGEDQLIYSASGGITGSWNGDTGQLILTGNADAPAYQQALRSVKYYNSSLNPSASDRTITVTVNNGFFTSNPVTRNIRIAPGNVPPAAAGIETEKLVYLKGITPLRQLITGTLTVSDSDNKYLYGAEVKFAHGYVKEEDYFDCSNTGALSGTFNKETGILSITGKATPQSYTEFIRGVSYRNSSGANGTSSEKLFYITFSDRLANSNTAQRSFQIKSPLETPANLRASIVSNAVELTWNDTNIGESGYLIERSEDNNLAFIEVGRTDSNAVRFTDSNIRNGKRYYYRIAAFKNGLKSDYSSEADVTGIVVGLSDRNGVPKEYIISQNYPNPFNPATSLIFGVPYESRVKIEIYNSLGQLIETLAEETKAPGYYKVIWNASNYASGVYIYRMSAVSIDGGNKFFDTKRMVLVK